jgi:hypothetical protein
MANIMTLCAAKIRQIATIYRTLSEQSAPLFKQGFLGLATHYEEAIAANLEAATGSATAAPADQQRFNSFRSSSDNAD